MCNFGCQAFIVRSKVKKNIECDPTKLRLNFYRENALAIQHLYEIICVKKGRQPLSIFDQKLARLKTLVPPEHLPEVQSQLLATLAEARCGHPQSI